MTAVAPSSRTERRFDPKSTVSPGVFLLVLNAGGLAAGAGAVGFYLRMQDAEAAPFTSGVLAVAALLMGVATVLASSRGVSMRVGPAGVAFEKADLVRIPWHGLESVRIEGDLVKVAGVTVYGARIEETCKLHACRDGLALLVAEASSRVPSVLHGDVAARVGAVNAAAGEVLPLEPVQVAGRRCAASHKPIAFESDGLTCERCERVYLKTAAPNACACGAKLG